MLLVARFVRLWLGPVNEHLGFLSGSFQVGLSSGPCLIARFCLSSESRYFLMRRCRVGGCDMIETRRDLKTKQGCFVPQKKNGHFYLLSTSCGIALYINLGVKQ